MKPVPLAEAIGQSIGRALGVAFHVVEAAGVGGGSIHAAMRIDGTFPDGARSCFAKSGTADRAAMFTAEAEGLAALRATGAVRIPDEIARGSDGEHAWLALEWLDLVPFAAASGASFGKALAAQHRQPRERFGWAMDNFIGATPQANGFSDDWLDFFRARRLQPQLRLAAKNRLPSRMIDRGERLLADCAAFFRHHVPAKSLLHGDLWGGNAAALADGTPVCFDPAVYVGDREADVAMSELFGGFPADFLSAYREAWPLPDEYRARRDFYNLYHLLNHANLFAGDYVARSERSIERLVAEIR